MPFSLGYLPLVVKDFDDHWIIEFLTLYGYCVQKSSSIVLESSKFIIVTPKIVRDIIRYKELLLPLNYQSLTERNDYIILLLRFVLRDNAFTELFGVPLVPVNCIYFSAFGIRHYYLALPSDLQFFPTVGCDVLITEELPDDIKSIFESDNFQSANKIKKLDLDGFNCLFRHELSHAPIRNWDPDTTTTFLNRRWLENLWERISQFVTQDLKLLRNYPLIPIITTTTNNYHHIYDLIPIKNELPILRFPKRKDGIMNVLKKLGVLFTEEFRIDTMKKFIWDWNLLMIIKAIEKSRYTNKTSMNSLFQPICNEEKDQLREYIVTNLSEIYQKDQFIDENIKDILRQLPIWPTYSADGSYIAAYCGWLVPHGLPYFQANLSKFLRLPTLLHPSWLCEYRFIPNNTKTDLRLAKELYDDRILLFTTVFAGSDVFIAPELRCGWLSNVLVSLGFNDKNILKSINFIPSKPVNDPYLETAKFKTSKLCSFNSLLLLKHMKLCWTQ
ncbi:22911_t:CDS:2, partial [Gigaspora margarita]